ncbi:MAG TPA: transcriptional repressor [Clostridiaceae bacterium]|nr:transcriptional repressor [Clostridiaceae bacterium]
MTKKVDNENIISRQGYRNTKSRAAVVEILENAEIPLSAEDIYLRMKESGRSASLSTVYRILELMENNRLVERTSVNNNKAMFTLVRSGHKHHLICTSCHKMVALGGCPLKGLESDISRETQFDITGHRLEVYGICPECRKR